MTRTLGLGGYNRRGGRPQLIVDFVAVYDDATHHRPRPSEQIRRSDASPSEPVRPDETSDGTGNPLFGHCRPTTIDT